jgi:hypothetical protein
VAPAPPRLIRDWGRGALRMAPQTLLEALAPLSRSVSFCVRNDRNVRQGALPSWGAHQTGRTTIVVVMITAAMATKHRVVIVHLVQSSSASPLTAGAFGCTNRASATAYLR